MFLSIIIPTYNEAENISKLLEQICQRVTGIECEILIVDDDSPDKTAEYVERFKDDYNAKTQNIIHSYRYANNIHSSIYKSIQKMMHHHKKVA